MYQDFIYVSRLIASSVNGWTFLVINLFIILKVRFRLLNGHLLGKSCPLGWSCILVVFFLFVISVIFRSGFEGCVRFSIASVPVHCLLVTFNLDFKEKIAAMPL